MIRSYVKADIRNNVGSNVCNRIRNEGHVPGVLYGPDVEPKNIEVDKRELSSILRHYGTTAVLDVNVGGQKMMSIIKDIQRHPVNNEIVHVDFQTVSYDKPIHAAVPIVLVDKDMIETKEATIQSQIRELQIECLPQNIPENIEISVRDLALGHPLKISNVEFSEDISVLHDPDEVIVSLAQPNKLIEETEVEIPLEEREEGKYDSVKM